MLDVVHHSQLDLEPRCSIFQSRLFAPGCYKTNYRALRFGKLARMQGLPGAFKGFLICRC